MIQEINVDDKIVDFEFYKQKQSDREALALLTARCLYVYEYAHFE